MILTALAAADGIDPARRGISLLHGWLPLTLQAVVVLAVLAVVGWRSRRWRLLWLPLAIAVGGGTALWAHWWTNSEGLAGDPAPAELWIWIGVTGFALAIAAFGWPSAGWPRRLGSLLALPLCLLGTAVAVNLWVGYYPTVNAAWAGLTAGDLPDQTDMATVTAMRSTGSVPAHGAVVPVHIPATDSGFKHRTEYVYLPPAWFAQPGTRLPTVLMIAGEFNTPADWSRSGDAISIIDEFAAAHDGFAPVFVFVDVGGSFNNDTECVDGPRGAVASHLTGDVVPYVDSTFGVSTDSAHRGIVGWSMGGTCAVDLTVMHPSMFSKFVDIAGDTGPNAGTREQTIERLYGGDAARWAAYDPATVMAAHGPYQGISGWFSVSGDKPPAAAELSNLPRGSGTGLGGQDTWGGPTASTGSAADLCSAARTVAIDCAVVTQPGKHTWPFASTVLRTSLPWLAGALGTPQVPAIPLPAGASTA